MVCLEADHDGNGSEFTQTSTTVPPPPPPFCPLACVSECGGHCEGVTPLGILAEARVCYQLFYPLTHQPVGSVRTDTWLVLRGDTAAPVGQWQYAAVFDDSIVRVAGWRRLEHAPPTADPQVVGADPSRKPHPNGLELALTLAGQNLRGELGYNDEGIAGMMDEEESGHGWGIEGKRRACPTARDVHP
jgi:hypothetical protein